MLFFYNCINKTVKPISKMLLATILLLLVFLFPVIYTMVVENMEHHNDTTEEPVTCVENVVCDTELTKGDTDIKFVALSRVYSGLLIKATVWVDLSQVLHMGKKNGFRLDILTNDLNSESEYVSLLKTPLQISVSTSKSRVVMDISTQLLKRELERDSVLLIKRWTDNDQPVYIPTIVQFEVDNLE